MKEITIVKISGNIIDEPEKMAGFLQDFANIPFPKILVHGGGKIASQLAVKLGIKPNMFQGRRITDKATLDITTMVYAGLLNKNIVAKLQSLQCNAIGLSGADANIIQSKKRAVKEVDYGFVGDVEMVDVDLILDFLKLGLTPVFNAITHNKKGQLLNTNADTIAAELAVALAPKNKVNLMYIFEKQGVLSDVKQNTVIENLNMNYYLKLKQEKIIKDGMIPKLDNCFYALKNGVQKVIIGGENLLSNNKEKYTQISL